MPRHAANTCPFQLSFLLGLLSLVYLYFFSRCGLLRLCLAPRHSLLSPSCDCFCLSYRQTKRRRCFASLGLARRLPYIPLTRAYVHVPQQTSPPPPRGENVTTHRFRVFQGDVTCHKVGHKMDAAGHQGTESRSWSKDSLSD